MISYQKISKVLIFLFPISMISGQMIPEIILILGLMISIFREYKNIKLDKISLSFLVLFFFLTLEIIIVYQNFEFQSIKQIFVFRFILYGLIISVFFSRDLKFLKNFFYFLIFIFIFLLFDSFYQFIIGENIIGLKNETHYRISSFFGDEYVLGSYIGRLAPILLSLSIYLFKKDNYFNYIILTSSLLITIISGDRISLVFSTSIFILHIFINFKLKYSFLFLFLIFSSFLISLLTIQSLNERIIGKTLSEIKIDNKLIYFTPYHHNYALVSLNMFKKKPYFGHGIKSFRLKCAENEFKKNILDEYDSCSTHSHNYYLQFLSENGIFNFLILLFIFFLSSFYCIKNLFKFFYTKNHLQLSKTYIYFGLLINLFPFMPSGNFYNGWLLCILTLYIVSINLYENEKNS
jgi:O-antigen ligase